MRRSPRSARWAILVTALVLVAAPLAMLLISSIYERVIVAQYERKLREIAEAVAGQPSLDLHSLGTREGVEILVLDASGQVVGSSETTEEAVRRSSFGGFLEGLLEGPHPARSSFRALDDAFGPLAERTEVQAALGGASSFAVHDAPNGEAVMVSATAPKPGGAVVVMKGSLRGLRRLFSLRFELVKLMAAQVLFALVVIFLLSRWLVRPLEQLADAVRAAPGGEVAAPALAERRDEIGELARTIVSVTRSLDEKRRAAAELAADLAHELKNPLATIAASSELIASTNDPNREKRELVHAHIEEAVGRLRNTTDELLGLMRLDVALAEQPREATDYRALLESLLGEYRRDPQHEGFTFTLDAPAELPRVALVPSAWAKLLRNLLDNALVQPAARQEVIVRAFIEGGELVTEVRDFGPGISPGNLDKIFRRFFTQRPEGAPPGTGLGLSIVQTVAESHRARVEVHSPPGAGAMFRVRLPL